MIEIHKTEVYARWLDGLRDTCARTRVLVRVGQLAAAAPETRGTLAKVFLTTCDQSGNKGDECEYARQHECSRYS